MGGGVSSCLLLEPHDRVWIKPNAPRFREAFYSKSFGGQMTDYPFFSNFDHVSFSVTVKLKTSFSGVESGSGVK